MDCFRDMKLDPCFDSFETETQIQNKAKQETLIPTTVQID